VIFLEELKAHLRISHDLEDELLDEYERAAVAYVGQRANAYYGEPRTRTVHLRGFDRLYLQGAVISVDAVTTDGGDVDHTVEGGVITIGSPRWASYAVTYEQGYDEDIGLEHVRQAVLMLVAHWYAHRTPVAIATSASEIPHGVDALVPRAGVVA
jgi:hypothetical protein